MREAINSSFLVSLQNGRLNPYFWITQALTVHGIFGKYLTLFKRRTVSDYTMAVIQRHFSLFFENVIFLPLADLQSSINLFGMKNYVTWSQLLSNYGKFKTQPIKLYTLGLSG